MGGESQQLLTDGDRRAHLHDLLGHRMIATERLLLPTLAQYNNLGSNSGLTTAAYDMCRQIGFKPGGLTIKFAGKTLVSGYQVDSNAKTILIDPQLATHPYSCGAIIALAVVAYAIEHFGHEVPTRSFTEFATVETGLGLWIVNALRPRLSLRQKLYHNIDTSWFHKDGIQLESYSNRQYVERVISFAHENHVAADTYLPYVLNRVRYLLPEFVLNQSNRYLPESPVSLAHRKSANILWAKVLLIALIVTSGVVFGMYVLASQETRVNPELDHLQHSISQLKHSYDNCQQDVSKKQSTYDTNDLFMTRQIDEAKSRCESLRNEYNYTLDQYQTLPKSQSDR